MSATYDAALLQVGWIQGDPDHQHQQPGVVAWQDSHWLVKTDGRLLHAVRLLPGQEAQRPVHPGRLVVEFLENLSTHLTASSVQPVDIARLRALVPAPEPKPPACQACGDDPQIDCPACDGRGSTDCECLDCGHEHEAECEKCDGTGCGTCPACGLRQGPVPRLRRVEVTGPGCVSWFDAELLVALLEHLGGAAEWQQAEPERPVRLRGDDWFAILMPLRHPDEVNAKPEYRVTLTDAAPLELRHGATI